MNGDRPQTTVQCQMVRSVSRRPSLGQTADEGVPILVEVNESCSAKLNRGLNKVLK